MKDLQSIRGVIPAMMTCFHKNGSFDEESQRALTEFLIGKGVDGLYLTGSTGEAFLMDGEERCAVVKCVAEQNRGRVPLIVHVGDIGTQKSIHLAQRAYELEADALSSVPPFYFHFSQDEIVQYYRELSTATPLPMVVYNIALAGAVGWDTIRRLAEIPNVKGMKYTLTTHHEIMRIKEEIGKDFVVYSGCDEMAMSGFAFGADGIIGSFYNIIPEIFVKMYHAMQIKDLETMESCQKLADAVILFMLKFPYFAAMKKLLQWGGYEFGYVRAPFASLNVQQENELLTGLHTIRERYGSGGIELLERLPNKID